VNRGTPSSRFKNLADGYTGKTANASDILFKLPEGGKLHRTGLSLPPDLELKAWGRIGARLARLNDSVQWALGDWWAYGYFAYGQRTAIVKAESLRYEIGTLMNFGSVALKIPPSLRNEVLSWSHHCAVVSLPPPQRKEWLAKAAEKKWSVRALRERIYERQIDDLDSQPDKRALSWYYSFQQQVESACASAIRLRGDDPRFDRLNDDAIAELVTLVSAVAERWTAIGTGLRSYREKRIAAGKSFVPRALEPQGVPRRVSEGRYDYNGDPILTPTEAPKKNRATSGKAARGQQSLGTNAMQPTTRADNQCNRLQVAI